MIRFGRLMMLLLAAVVLLTVGACWAVGLVHAAPPPPLPAPTGPHPVGRVEAVFTDPGRQREVMVSAWYPAAGGGAVAPYIPADSLLARTTVGVQAAMWLHSPAAAPAMIAATVPATEGATAARGPLPVVVMSPGLGTPRWILSGLALDLASHGYAAVVIDHTGESPAVEFPDGRIVSGTPPGDDSDHMRQQLTIRVADARLVLDRLPTLPIVGPLLDLSRIAMAGHSYGGYTTVAAMAADRRIRAGVVLDGSAGWDGTPDLPAVDRPVLVLAEGDMVHASWIRFGHITTGPFQLATVHGAAHYSPTDLPAFTPHAADLCGSLPAATDAAITRDVATGFLGQQLQGIPAPPSAWPEVDWRTR